LNSVTLVRKPGILWCLFFLLLYSGPPKFRIREGGAGVTDGLDLALVIQVIVFLGAGIYLLAVRRKVRFGLAQRFALVLLGVFFLSAFRSDYPAYTIFRSYQGLVLFWFSAVYIEEFGVLEHSKWLLWAGALTCFLVLLCIPLNPDAVLEYSETGFPRLRGAGVAETGYIGPLLFTVAMAERTWLRWLCVFSGGLIAFFSLSRAAWLSVALVVLLVSLWRPKVWSVRLSRFAIVGMVLFALLANVSGLIEKFREPPESLVNLTGRPLIWANVAETVWNGSPWIGYGHSAASRELTWDIDPALGSAHSIFVDAFAGSGLIGLAATFILAVTVLGRCWKAACAAKEAQTFVVCALSLVILGLGVIGGDIDTGPYAFVYWALPTSVTALMSSERRLSCMKRANIARFQSARQESGGL